MSRRGVAAAGPMAPAGWWLSNPLLGPMRRFGAAVILAAGPWLVSVFALAVVSVALTPMMGLAAVEDLRLTVVYAFCVAPLVAGPVGAVAARRIALCIDHADHARIPELFVAAALLSCLLAQGIGVGLWLVLRIGPAEVAVAFLFLTGSAALLWTCFAVLAAIRAHGYLIAAFTAGMALSVLCALLAASHGPTTQLLIWCFTAGILFCVALCLRRVRSGFPGDLADFPATLRALLADLRDLAVLGCGVFFAISGVWVDKWVFWFGPEGQRSASGLLHYSAYDGVMFIAHLSVIPSYAALMVFHHGDLVMAIGRFRAAIAARATGATLRECVTALERTAWSGLFTIFFVQAALTLGLVLMAPLLATWMNFDFNQFLMLRVGLVGVLLHGGMFLCCAVLLVANCNRHFMLLQGGFLVSNLMMSILLHRLIGPSPYAFFFSSLIVAPIAFRAARHALHDYDYLSFLGENDSLFVR